MEKDIATFFKAAGNEALTSSEKEQARRMLLAYVDALPIREAAPAVRGWRMMPSLFFSGKFMPVFGVLLAASLAMGGVSFAAEGALPGDMLYPVKVAVNEEVRAALSVTPAAKADWESRRAERRLEEAERLAAKDRLDAEARVDLEQRLAVHAGRVTARVDLLESKKDFEGAVDVGSRLEETLSAHGTILSRIGGKEVDTLAAAVGSRTVSAGKERAKNADVVADDRDEKKVSASARVKMEVAAKAIAEARSLLAGNGSADAEARLIAADEAYAEGRAKLDAGESGQAFVLFQKAQRNAREASVLLRAQKRSDVRVKREDRKESRKQEKDAESDDRREKGEARVEADADAGAELKIDARSGIRLDTEGHTDLRFGR